MLGKEADKLIRVKKEGIPKTLQVTLAFTICNVIQKGIAFFTIPFFTRFLSTSQMGQVTVYMSWLEILTVFLTLQLPYGSFSKAMIKFESSRDEYLSSVEGIVLTLTIIYLFILYFFGTWISSVVHISKGFLFIMAFEILSNSGLLFWSARKRMDYEYLSVVLVTLLVSVLSPILSFLLIFHMDERGNAKILGNSFIVIIVGLIIFIICLFKGGKFFDKSYWKYAFGFNIPLIPYYLSQIVFNSSDRIMIEQISGEDKAGIYGVVYNLAFVLMFLLNAFNNAYTPWFLNKIKTGDVADNIKLTNYISVVFSSFICMVVMFAPEMVYVLGGDEYIEAVWIVPPVALSLILLFYTQIFANYEFYYEKKRYLVISSILAAVINITLNYLTVPKLGYIAAGYTTFLSYLIMMLVNYFAAKKLIVDSKLESSGFDMKRLLIVFFSFLIFSIICMTLYYSLVIRVIIACTITIFLIAFRKKIISSLLVIRDTMKD